MKITLTRILIRELVEGFQNNDELGVVGYSGKLNIRPPYQREFVYKDQQQKDVINSIFNNFPLNVMYWVRNLHGGYELLDGQQRTLSICTFYLGNLFVKVKGVLKDFQALNREQKEAFLNYPLQIYICENGTFQEQLDWFRIINIAGERLTQQELFNAVYTGPWITHAKKRFSKTNCVAYQLGEKYMDGSPIRQAYLEAVLKWISGGNIEQYMATHINDENSDREWQYFQSVIRWVETLFPKEYYRKEMKGLPWGELYNRFKDNEYLASDLEKEVARLMEDSDVKSKKGIYEYVLSGDEHLLQLRAFDNNVKREAYERQGGICAICGKHFEFNQMEGDHITPWREGGKTVADNCQMLCRECNRRKGPR